MLPCFGFGHPRPRPSFLPKNERERHRMRPVTFPAWFVDSSHHPLCPVSALDSYLAATSRSTCQQLWVDPVSLRPLKTSDISKGLTSIIRLADPSASAKAHDVRKFASSLAFFRCFDVEEVRLAGQWSSSTSFVTRYLLHHLRDVPCVAMGSLLGSS